MASSGNASPVTPTVSLDLVKSVLGLSGKSVKEVATVFAAAATDEVNELWVSISVM